ncbi:uncharacterized protein LOC127002185 isoform X2 [Eriocheir sinensis]|uniref:uncharacterized protein LOC127002185 isoform X2 n=1 Tax=Eriocheir sinensis TaxID=95602 RepID=UPI0021CAD085|nr:uncharacterized protein LOC127002185 isoform X2 [Eriocheir sinensis]
MPTSCIVRGCRAVYVRGNNKIRFHRLPKDQELRRKWMEICDIKDCYSRADSIGYVCSRHFENSAFERNIKYELLGLPVPPNNIKFKHGAVPTLHLPNSDDRSEKVDLMDLNIKEEDIEIKEEDVEMKEDTPKTEESRMTARRGEKRALSRSCSPESAPKTKVKDEPELYENVAVIDWEPSSRSREPDHSPMRPMRPQEHDHTPPTAPALKSLAEVKSQKRAKGPITDTGGTPIIKLQSQSVMSEDGSMWHRDPNPNLAKKSASQQLPAGQLASSIDGRRRPEELFEVFIPDTELADINYHTCKKIDSLRPKFRQQDSLTIEPVTVMELKALLGILIASGIKGDNHAETAQMWSPFEGCPLYRSTMTNARFCFLLSALRFDNSDTRSQRLLEDKLAPIRSLWDACVASCWSCYVPGPHFTIGEQFLPFRGNCSFSTNITNKPAEYGLKIMMLCDSETNFMCNAMPYLGKGTVTLPKDIKIYGEYYMTELTQRFLRRGRTVTADNHFSTLSGALRLRDRGLEFVGTIKPEPCLPKAVLDEKLKDGETVAAFNYNKKVTLVCHRTNETEKVQLLSTIHHNPTVVEEVKTDVQMFYNATKGGVDMFDQLCTKTSCSRMTNRWSLCFFFGIINLAYTNAYILHQVQNRGRKTMTRREFGMKLAEELCKPWALKRLQTATLPCELRYLIGSVYGMNGMISDHSPKEPAPGLQYHSPEEPAPGPQYHSPEEPAPGLQYHSPEEPAPGPQYHSPEEPAPGLQNHSPKEPAPGLQEGSKKCMRCYLCPSSSIVMSRVTCATCQRYTCPRHCRITCATCAS